MRWSDPRPPPVLVEPYDRFPDQPEDGDVTAMVVRGESEQGYSDVGMLRRILLDLAEERARITTAYLSPDGPVLSWLRSAARRGVRVELLVPGPRTDREIARLAAEHVYEQLLDAGVELHEFRPTMLHPKVMTVDGIVAVVGSSNLNMRSFRHDEEVDVVLFDRELTALLDAHADADRARSRRIDREGWDRRSSDDSLRRRLVGLVDRWI